MLRVLARVLLLLMVQAEAAAAAAKVQLPADMVQTAKSFGVRSTALSKYISLQVRLAVLGGVNVQQHAGACYLWQLRKLCAFAEVAA
jgi:hypothetical protein